MDPIWAHMGLIWAHMGPYGSIWAHLGLAPAPPETRGPARPPPERRNPPEKTLSFLSANAGCGPYGPIWAHVGPYVSSSTGLGRCGHVRFPTFGPISHVSGPKLGFLTKFIDDSASFLLEKLKNQVILIKNLNI